MTAKFRVQISRSGQRDLIGIQEYLTSMASPTVADAKLGELLHRIEALEAFPERGAIPSEMEAIGFFQYRQLNHGHYRIIYRIVDRTVVVTLIADGRQDMRSLLRRRLLGR